MMSSTLQIYLGEIGKLLFNQVIVFIVLICMLREHVFLAGKLQLPDHHFFS